jgi:hypothetical protein
MPVPSPRQGPDPRLYDRRACVLVVQRPGHRGARPEPAVTEAEQVMSGNVLCKNMTVVVVCGA